MKRLIISVIVALTLAGAPAAAAYVYTDGLYYERLAYPVNSTQYRTLLLHNCVPLDGTLKYWACPQAPPHTYL